MTNEKLVSEARRLENDYGDSYEVMTHMSALADALEAANARIAELEAKLAARQPSEDGEYILRLIETIKQTGGSVEVAGVKIMPCDEFGRTAAVPEAAIRELTEAIRLTVEYVGNDMLPAIEGWNWYDALVKYAPEVAQAFVDKPIHFPKPTNAGAERDAALAAIKRVAALHIESDWKCGNPRHTNPEIGCPECYTECETCDRTYPCDTRAALDGAPEPEWEYAKQLPNGNTFHPAGSDDDGLGVTVRRRKAGPGFPVEGEKP